MARKNPIGILKDAALDVLMHPVGTTGKAVEHAKGTAAIGRMVVGQVGRTAVSTAAQVAGTIIGRTASEPTTASKPSTPRGATAPSSPADLRPVPSAEGPATAVAVDAPAKQQGDPVVPTAKPSARKAAPDQEAAQKAAAKKAAAKKAAVKKAPVAKKTAVPDPAAKKAAAENAPAKKAVAKKTAVPDPPAKKAAAEKAPAKKAAAEEATAPVTGIDSNATPAEVDVTPADIAKVVAKAPAKKAAAKQTPAKRAAQKTAKKAPAKQAPAEGAAADEDTLVYSSDSNDGPARADTDGDAGHLEQPLLDPAVAKAVATEADTAQKDADPDRG